jgi:hypothetical protein
MKVAAPNFSCNVGTAMNAKLVARARFDPGFCMGETSW